MIRLKEKTKAVTGMCRKCSADSARPVVPPVIMPLGRMKATTARAYRAFPARTTSTFRTLFEIEWSFVLMESVLFIILTG